MHAHTCIYMYLKEDGFADKSNTQTCHGSPLRGGRGGYTDGKHKANYTQHGTNWKGRKKEGRKNGEKMHIHAHIQIQHVHTCTHMNECELMCVDLSIVVGVVNGSDALSSSPMCGKNTTGSQDYMHVQSEKHIHSNYTTHNHTMTSTSICIYMYLCT